MSVERLALRTEEAAQALGIAPQTLHHWRRQKKGPNYSQTEPGAQVLYSVEDLKAWLRENRVLGGSHSE